MKKQINKLKKGFTLAELMAVIAIMAILAAIALGSYRKSIERARFSDGLTSAHALMAAVDAYYYENDFKEPANLNSVAISLANTESASGNAITTKSFVYTYYPTDKKITAARIDRLYSITVYSEREGGTQQQDECTGLTADGKDFCESMGYKNCTGSVCRK